MRSQDFSKQNRHQLPRADRFRPCQTRDIAIGFNVRGRLFHLHPSPAAPPPPSPTPMPPSRTSITSHPLSPIACSQPLLAMVPLFVLMKAFKFQSESLVPTILRPQSIRRGLNQTHPCPIDPATWSAQTGITSAPLLPRGGKGFRRVAREETAIRESITIS